MGYNKLCSLLAGLFFIFSSASLPAQEKDSSPRPALFWEKAGENDVRCLLCPRKCLLKPGEKGFCRSRKNINGTLCSLTYGMPVALHVDPIEKKPFFHVYPGSRSFSLATAGCNLRCKFCQNWEISQLDPEKASIMKYVPPEEIARMAGENGCRTIAFTYTEPTVFYEYMLDIAEKARRAGIDCVMHSCGFINEEPLRRLADHLTAANIDLKGFSEEYYSSMCQGELKTVLNTLRILKEKKVWLEITTLLVPGQNDSDQDLTALCRWIKENLGEDTPLHFSRFFPMYKLKDLPPTPIATLKRARDIALKAGLKYVYIGNVPGHQGEDTVCPVCGETLIRRLGYTILENRLKQGACPVCGTKIPGLWP